MEYYIQLFRNDAMLKSGNHDIYEIYYQVRQTLKNLMKSLLLRDHFYLIDQQYDIGKALDATVEAGRINQ